MSSPPQAHASALVLSALERLRRRIRAYLVFERTTFLIGGLVAGALLIGLLDYLVRMPGAMRIVLWLAGLLMVGIAIRRQLLPAWRFAPRLSDLALRVERTEPAGKAGLQGVLASAVEFAETQRGPGASLTDSIVKDAADRVARVPASQLVRSARTVLSTGPVVLATTVLVVGLVAMAAPALTLIGAARVLAPWSGATWPSRTMVLDATVARSHPIGTALPLRALLTRTNQSVGLTRVRVWYRLSEPTSEGAEAFGRWESALMTSQGQRSNTTPPAELLERLLDTRALAGESTSASSSLRTLEFWFEAPDSRTEPARVTLVEPPAIRRVQADVRLPAYASDIPSSFVSGERDLGPARGEMTTLTPILAGSEVALILETSRPIAIPAPTQAARYDGFVQALLRGEQVPADLRLESDANRLILRFTAERSLRFASSLVDEHGVESIEATGLSLVVVEDRPPTAQVVQPATDESVLPSAVLDLVGEARDDVAVASLSLEAQTLRRPADSPGAPPAPDGQPRTLAALESPAPTEARVTSTLELRSLDVRPGDEVHLTAVARDGFAFRGRTNEPAVSPVRRLRVLGEAEFVEQIVAELGSLRAAARRLDEDQQRLQKDLATQRANPEARGATRLSREQESLTQRLVPPASLVRRLADRVERNALTDRTLREMLRDAEDLLERAATDSRDAQDALRPRAGEDAEAPDEASLAQAQAEQSNVRDALTRLSTLLDQGREGWATRREVERLLEDQQRLSQQARDLAAETAGKRPEELSAEQREALERLAQSQRDLAQRARTATDALQDRAQRSRAQDPAQAEAMQKAAERAARDELAETMRQAAQSVGENRTQNANDLQQRAEQTLREMMSELDEGQRQRDETLQRLLVELSSQIDDLIARQQQEIDRLARPADQRVGAGEVPLDQALIRLNQDTLVLAESVGRGPPETLPIGEKLEAAGASQAKAIGALRAATPDEIEADRAQREALARLNEARTLAQQLREQSEEREQDRKRAELRKKYEEALARQISIRADALPFAGRDLSRRDRAALRALSDKQDTLRGEMASLRDGSEEFKDAGVFRMAHDRLDRVLNRAVTPLREGTMGPVVDREMSAGVSLLRSLVDALASSPDKEKDFRDGAQGGGGGGGGGGEGEPPPVIPPLAELRLLRDLQAEAAAETRSLSETPDPSPESLEELGVLQRTLAEEARALLERLSNAQQTKPNEKEAEEKPAEKAPPEERPVFDPAPPQPEAARPNPPAPAPPAPAPPAETPP